MRRDLIQGPGVPENQFAKCPLPEYLRKYIIPVQDIASDEISLTPMTLRQMLSIAEFGGGIRQMLRTS